MDMSMSSGTPWLDFPLMLESGREYTCKFMNPTYCQYYEYRWRFWYIADWVYALPTVSFFTATIALFTFLHVLRGLLPASVQRSTPLRQLSNVQRFLSYRTYRISALNWNSAPLGILFLGLLGFLFFFLMVLVPQPYYWPENDEGPYGDSPALATRSGWLSLACLPFVFATAGKSNLISMVTGISYERLQVFHRWISYAFFITALLHTFPFIVYNISQGTMVEAWNGSLFYWTGVVALLAQAYLTFASIGPLRNMSYEWFKFSHFLAALVFTLFLFFHCDYTLTSWHYFIATGVLFVLSWSSRQIQTYFKNGIRHRASLEVTSNSFIKLTIPTKVRWTAGQHFFIRFFGVGVHTFAVHPFSVCSLPQIGNLSDNLQSELTFLIRPHRGLTARLLRRAQEGGQLAVTLDGPYGGVEMKQLEISDRIILIAGGSGVGWILPMVIAYIRRLQYLPQQDVHPASLLVILSSRDKHTAQWFQECVEALLAAQQIDGRESNINVQLYYTGISEGASLKTNGDIEKNGASINGIAHSSDDTSCSSGIYSHFDHRPDLHAIISNQTTTGGSQRTAVFVCGPLSMQHDVSNAVAKQQLHALAGGMTEVTLHMEHFSWA